MLDHIAECLELHEIGAITKPLTEPLQEQLVGTRRQIKRPWGLLQRVKLVRE